MAKDTTKEENMARLEDLLRNPTGSGGGEEPGNLMQGKPIEQDDEPAPEDVKPVVKWLTSAGYTPVWDTKTGVRSIINNNMLPRTLRKQRPDGSYIFTIRRPSIVPRRGIYKCLLHKEDPNRAHYDELGLAVCTKDNLGSPYQVERHMKKKHKMEWAAIEKERIDKEKKEDREFQQRLMEKAVGEKPKTEDIPRQEVGTKKAPLYVSDKDKKKAKSNK